MITNTQLEQNNTKELIKCVFELTHSKSFIEDLLSFIETDKEINEVLNFVRNNPKANKSDILYETANICAQRINKRNAELYKL